MGTLGKRSTHEMQPKAPNHPVHLLLVLNLSSQSQESKPASTRFAPLLTKQQKNWAYIDAVQLFGSIPVVVVPKTAQKIASVASSLKVKRVLNRQQRPTRSLKLLGHQAPKIFAQLSQAL